MDERGRLLRDNLRGGDLQPATDGVRGLWLRLLAVGAIVTVAIPLVVRLIGGSRLTPDGLERVDRATWAALLIVAAVSLGVLIFWRIPKRCLGDDVHGALLCLVLGAEVVAVVWLQPLYELEGILWFGFGVPVLLASIVAVPVLYFVAHSPNTWVPRYVLIVSVVVALVVYLPSVLQPAWGVMDGAHSGYVVNEVLGPANGHFAMGDQVAQYTGLLGIPLAAAIWVFGHPVGAAFAYLTCLAILTVLGLVVIAFRVLPDRMRWLSVLLTVPLVLVKVQPADTPLGSIATSLSALPARTFLVVLIGLLLVYSAGREGRRWVFAVGLVAGAAALNNVEFGVPALVAAALVCILRSRSGFRPRSGGLVFVAGVFTPAVLYSLLLVGVGQGPHWSAWWAFAAAFASGFGAIAMPPVGTHILITMTFLAGAIAGAFYLRRMPRQHLPPTDAPQSVRLAAASAATFFGLAGLGSFGYYVGRSITSVQLQVFLIYLVPIVCAQWALVGLPRLRASAGWTEVLTVAALLLPSGLAVASLLQAPDPSYEWQRAAARFGSSTSSTLGSPYDVNAASVAADVQAFREANPGRDLVGAVSLGNIVESLVGLRNFSALNQPREASISGLLQSRFCAQLSQAQGAIYVRDFDVSSFWPACSRYRVLQRFDSGGLVVEADR